MRQSNPPCLLAHELLTPTPTLTVWRGTASTDQQIEFRLPLAYVMFENTARLQISNNKPRCATTYRRDRARSRLPKATSLRLIN
jgi:hypothetical protein